MDSANYFDTFTTSENMLDATVNSTNSINTVNQVEGLMESTVNQVVQGESESTVEQRETQPLTQLQRIAKAIRENDCKIIPIPTRLTEGINVYLIKQSYDYDQLTPINGCYYIADPAEPEEPTRILVQPIVMEYATLQNKDKEVAENESNSESNSTNSSNSSNYVRPLMDGTWFRVYWNPMLQSWSFATSQLFNGEVAHWAGVPIGKRFKRYFDMYLRNNTEVLKDKERTYFFVYSHPYITFDPNVYTECVQYIGSTDGNTVSLEHIPQTMPMVPTVPLNDTNNANNTIDSQTNTTNMSNPTSTYPTSTYPASTYPTSTYPASMWISVSPDKLGYKMEIDPAYMAIKRIYRTDIWSEFAYMYIHPESREELFMRSPRFRRMYARFEHDYFRTLCAINAPNMRTRTNKYTRSIQNLRNRLMSEQGMHDELPEHIIARNTKKWRLCDYPIGVFTTEIPNYVY